MNSYAEIDNNNKKDRINFYIEVKTLGNKHMQYF